ncbi:hypothetical protein BOTNAR_0718g00020 [Botryotinia narcissicola]|uniref:Uncharacterized protein n=1 Tax=Botryotinia narcissicola TaxID=278944 RepID=A0A4Z1H7Z0_9HELO|nr:hypothetical protein BOTNAR_0718g00020 [Botryotinia narcissicola]
MPERIFVLTSSQNVYLSSESHFSFFKHDAEIHKSYKGQLEVANERIRYLESKLQDQESHLREYDLTQKRLYESERTRTLEISARLRVQCHLKIEQTKSLEFAQEVRNLQERLNKMAGDYTGLQAHFLDIISAIATFNDILRGETNELHQVMQNQAEIIHNQHVINSLASKISLYDKNADKVLESLQLTQWKLNDSKRSAEEVDTNDRVLKKLKKDQVSITTVQFLLRINNFSKTYEVAMQRINRSSLESSSDKLHAPMAIDIQIGLQRGSTAALEVTPERLQATKQMQPPSTAQWIEELTKENGRLRF